ncbi:MULTISPECIES: DUF454 family protein [Methylococcus]|uniref:DUF454 family protein n=1 Tax=Methylococcus capsulatus TaxID=414 RepID=A0ABZ2F3X4_METCP|nr:MULTISPECIES: DUF454 family protein [Methylococcus]MDF9393868.1 DUF454 family protein [Methylococcus capsulatus]
MNVVKLRPGKPLEFFVHLDRQSGRLRIDAPRIFNQQRRGCARTLIEKATSLSGVRSASIDLVASACVLEFDPGSDLQRLSEAFAAELCITLASDSRDSRAKSTWDVLAAFPGKPSAMLWEARLQTPDRLDLRIEAASSKPIVLLGIADRLDQVDGIQSCRIGFVPQRLMIDLSRSELSPLDIIHAAHRQWSDMDTITAAVPPRPVPRFLQIPYLFSAGVSFLLTLAALIIPGLPTVPFLVATSFFLARSSPRLYLRLQGFPLFGPVLREWERFHSLGTESKDKLLKLSLGVLALSVVLYPLDPIALGLAFLLGFITVFRIRSLPSRPGVPADEDQPAFGQPAVQEP